MIDWISSIPTQLQTGLIAAIATVVGIVLKDYAFQRAAEMRANRKQAIEVYRNYADPIAAAAASLFWRLREVLTQDGRGDFLKESGASHPFDKYKYESTLYRIAALIAWLRAYRRELTLFSLRDPEKLQNLTSAIRDFEGALADGAHIEVQRLRSVANLWDIALPDNIEQLSGIAVSVEQVIKAALHNKSANVVSELDSETHLCVCKRTRNIICARIGIAPVPDAIIEETLARAVRSLSIREAWLYRDFQSGVGDIMIEKVEGASRRFEVIGFKNFESILMSQDPNDKQWMQRLSRIIEGLDISGADRFDARVFMLEETFLKTIQLLEALAKIDPDRGSVAENVLSEGVRLAKNRSWRRSATM